MFDGLWYLELNGVKLGLRLRYKDVYYDIRLDNLVGFDINSLDLPVLALVVDEDDLKTKDELEGKICVVEAISNPKVYIEVLMLLSNFKLDKKLFDSLESKYLNLIPGHCMSDFTLYYQEYISVNSNVFKRLSSKQVEAIRDFFMWGTKNLYKDMLGSSNLCISADVRSFCKIKGYSGNWLYIGSSDSGFFGGSICDDGHPLRYGHYAVNVNSSDVVVFGYRCVKDFFNIEANVLSRIKLCVDLISREVFAMLYYLEMVLGYYEEDYSNFDSDLAFVLSTSVGKEYKSDLEIIVSFRDCGLPLTKSLFSTFTKVKDLAISSSRLAGVLRLVEKSVDVETINNFLNSTPNSVFHQALRYCSLYKTHENKQFIVEGYSILSDSLKFVNLANSIPRIEVSLETYLSPNYNKSVEGVLRPISRIDLRMLNFLSIGLVKQFTSLGEQDESVFEDFIAKFLSNIDLVRRAINWGLSDDFKSLLTPISYVEKVDDNITLSNTILRDINIILEAFASGRLVKSASISSKLNKIKKEGKLSKEDNSMIDGLMVKLNKLF